MDPKLLELTEEGNFRAKVSAILDSVKWKQPNAKPPYIVEANRTVERQRELVKKGYSKTMRSNHIGARFKDKKARAVDIVPKTEGWNAPKRFWLLVGSASWGVGVGWGGLFGLSGKQKKALKQAIITLRQLGWPPLSEHYRVKIGWDPAHVEKPVNW